MKDFAMLAVALVFYVLSRVVENETASLVLMSLAVGVWLMFFIKSTFELFYSMKEAEKSSAEWAEKWRKIELEQMVREEVKRRIESVEEWRKLETARAIREEVTKQLSLK